MSSPFQTALKDRAAERAREWEAARDASVGLAEATAAVRSRRRGRGVLAAAGCVAAGVALAAVTYGLLGAGSARETAMPAGGKQAIDALAAVGADDVVLTLWEELPNPGLYAPRYSVAVVDGTGKLQARLSYDNLTDALGSSIDGWPAVTFVEIAPDLDRAVFELSSSVPDVATRIAILDLDSGEASVADPCTFEVDALDLTQWCDTAPVGGAVVIDPQTGKALAVSEYKACIGADARFEDHVLATCTAGQLESYFVTLDPATGKVVEAESLGLAPLQEPLVVGGELYVNQYSTEGDPVLANVAGPASQIGGAPAAGLAAMGEGLLVQTESDAYGGVSTFGKAVGLWVPSTGEFTESFPLTDVEARGVAVVTVTR